MNNLQVFENPEFGKVRSVNVNGEPWLVGSDVATSLGYADAQKAIKNHVDEDDKLIRQISVSGQMRNVICINESGVYSLIFSSKLPKAKEFKHWVTSEVLPAIRKTGSYSQPKRELPTPKRSILEIQMLENDNDLEVRIMKSVGYNADIETMIGYAIVDMAVKRGLYTADLAATCLNKGMEAYVHTRQREVMICQLL